MRRRLRYSNWSGRHSTIPSAWEAPGDEEAVAALVRRAVAEGRRVKVVGAGHSWSDIGMPDDILVSLDGIADVRAIDRDAGTITVGAGIRLWQLNARLAEAGLALPILGSVTEQSVAGVASTATHGSSLVHGNIASGVVGARLVTGRGDVLALGADDPRLAAARVGLGALGILTEITIRVVPAFNLREEVEPVAVEQAAADVEAIARSAEYVKIWHLPHTGMAQVFRYTRTDEAPNLSRVARWIDDHVVNRRVFPALLRFSGRRPASIPRMNRIIARTYLKPTTMVAGSVEAFTLAMPPRHRETEYAVAIGDARAAFEGTLALIERERLRVNFPLEVRFVRGDDAWMSPAYGRDTCQLGAYSGQAPDLDPYFRGFERLMDGLDGRPHWGKETTISPAKVLARLPMAAEFLALRGRLDPHGVFANGFLDRVLGPRAAAG